MSSKRVSIRLSPNQAFKLSKLMDGKKTVTDVLVSALCEKYDREYDRGREGCPRESSSEDEG